MAFLKAAAKSKNPKLAAAALAYLMSI